jgi:hypothetical protein
MLTSPADLDVAGVPVNADVLLPTFRLFWSGPFVCVPAVAGISAVPGVHIVASIHAVACFFL